MDDLEANQIRELLSVPNESDIGGRPLSISRRRFLQLAGGGAAAAGAASIPWLSQAAAFAAPSVGAGQGILVLVEMNGGNDGLNTLVPVADPAYRSTRPTIGYAGTDVLDLGNGYGLNPRLVRMKQRWDAGQLAVVQGVGYANPNLSHFDSMATVMTGWGGGTRTGVPTGWIGRWLDTLPNAAAEPLYAVTIGSSVPLHLQGLTARASGLPLDLGDAFGTNRTDPADARMFDAVARFAREPTGLGPLADYFAYSEYQTMQLANRIKTAYAGWQPTTDIGRQLLLCARLINADLGIRVFNVQLDGFDTHTGERATHEELMRQLDQAQYWFFRNVKTTWRDRVALCTFSEFGRRVEENDGNGTDHGTASVMMLVGNKVRGGIRGAAPSLTNLDDDGNMVATVDFRRVYATILQRWLRADHAPILGRTYPLMSLFSSPP